MKGITIRLGRVRRGMTQTELGKRIGLTQAEVSKLERGIYQTSAETSAKIRQTLRNMREQRPTEKEKSLDSQPAS